MYLSEGVVSQQTLALVTEVKEYFAKLCQENPAEAALFRQKLIEAISDLESSSASEDPQAQEYRRTQLLALRDWEEERARLADQLRSGPGQLLANAAVELTACIPLLETDAELVRQGLKALEQELRLGLDDLRRILSELEPPHLIRELGLFNTIQTYAQRIAKGSDVTVDLRFPAQRPRFPPIVELGIYRIVQEALRNAVKHARAKTITVSVDKQSEDWHFTVQDDGAGFEPGRLFRARGLVKMYEWANAFGGLLEVRSKPGGGTIVALTIPASIDKDSQSREGNSPKEEVR